jgi:hypothetical protein
MRLSWGCCVLKWPPSRVAHTEVPLAMAAAAAVATSQPASQRSAARATGPAAGDVHLSSAASVLALLEEEDEVLQAHALEQLVELADHHWVELADWLSRM